MFAGMRPEDVSRYKACLGKGFTVVSEVRMLAGTKHGWATDSVFLQCRELIGITQA